MTVVTLNSIISLFFAGSVSALCVLAVFTALGSEGGSLSRNRPPLLVAPAYILLSFTFALLASLLVIGALSEYFWRTSSMLAGVILLLLSVVPRVVPRLKDSAVQWWSDRFMLALVIQIIIAVL